MEEDDSDSDITEYDEADQMETSDSDTVVDHVPQFLRIMSDSPAHWDEQSNDSFPSYQSDASMSYTSSSSSVVQMINSPISSSDENSNLSSGSVLVDVALQVDQSPDPPISSASSSMSDAESDSNDGVAEIENVADINEPSVVDITTPPRNNVQQAEVAGASAVCPSSSSPKSRKRPAEDSLTFNDSQNEDGSSCSICLDSYTNAGEHRIVSIKCGHLFGKSCIERWLKVGCPGPIKRCPECNTKSSVKDIRVVYARRLTAMDTAENERLKQELEKVYSDYKRLEVEVVKKNINIEMLEKQFVELQKEMKAKFVSGAGSSSNGCIHCNRSQSAAPRLVHTHKFSKGGGRVLAHNKFISLLIASQASSNPLFQGFGITKINSLDLNISEFMFLHPKPIRDLAFHPNEYNVLLSVSLDKTAKLVDTSCNSVVQTYQVESPAWSCCWDIQNPNTCFIGTQTGSILQYDRRRNDKVVLEFPGDRTPIVSLSSVPAGPGRTLPKGGFLACRLNSVWAFERGQDESYCHRRLPLDGTFISLSFDAQEDLILSSARPNQQCATARHMVHQLTPSDNPLLCQHLHTFHGGSIVGNLSRSRLFRANKEPLVCAFNESSKTIDAFHLSTFSKKFSLSSKDNESVSDLIPVDVNNSMHLATVSENYLSVYSIPSK